MEYKPDRWLLVKLTPVEQGGGTEHYRVFGCWHGSFTDGESWKLNSGVVGVTMDGNCYLFEGSSGSVYRCHKSAYGISGYGQTALNNIIERTPYIKFTVLESTVDPMSLSYS